MRNIFYYSAPLDIFERVGLLVLAGFYREMSRREITGTFAPEITIATVERVPRIFCKGGYLFIMSTILCKEDFSILSVFLKYYCFVITSDNCMLRLDNYP